MIKKEAYTYMGGMNMDSPPSKRPKDQYIELRNGRITSSYSDGDSLNIGSDSAIRCQSGNELSFTFTSIDSIMVTGGVSLRVAYTISGVSKSKTFTNKLNPEILALNSLITPGNTIEILASFPDGRFVYFLTTSSDGLDAIWRWDGTNDVELIYINNLGWSTNVDKNFDIVVNTESESVVKIYIASGENQVFSLNTLNDADIDKPKKILWMVPQYDLSEPVVKEQITGGIHTSGAIQYTYNLFNINGGQTKISPTSELVFMGKTNNGGDVNEIVGLSNIVEISDIDDSYDFIRIYSIKYNDLNTVPIVSVVGEYNNPHGGSLIITDDGRVKYNISIEALAFLGGVELIPRCIISKKNRLIIANITEGVWDLNEGLAVDDANYFDSRAYSSNGSNVVITDKNNNSLTLDPTSRAYTSGGEDVPITHDAIQDKSTYWKYPPNTAIAGGEGRHISYQIKKTTISDIVAAGYDPNESRYMKAGEVYRWAVEFYDNESRKSLPQWIADVKVPEDYVNFGGLSTDTRITIEFTISSDGITILQSQNIVGYKFLRVERLESDRSIVAQGIVTPMIFQETSDAAKDDANETNGNAYKNLNVKISSPWVRHYQDQIDIAQSLFDPGLTGTADVKIFKLEQVKCVSPHNPYGNDDTFPVPWTEVYRDADVSPAAAAGLHITFQDNRIMQLFSPETIFGNPILYRGMKLRHVASLQQTKRSCHGKLVYADTGDLSRDLTSQTKTNLFDVNNWKSPGTNTFETGNFLHANGYIGPNKPYPTNPGIRTEQLIQYYREYGIKRILSKKSSGALNEINILGSPELSRSDSTVNIYNGKGDFRYTNSLQSILADGRVESVRGSNNNGIDTPIFGVDAIAVQNITFMESTDGTAESVLPYETIFNNALIATTGSSPTSTDNVLLAEVCINLENQYGGHYYEDRSVNKYIPVGKYQTVIAGDNVYNIINSGDVFVGNFMFSRIVRTPGANFSDTRMQMSEIVMIPVETTINLKMRSDNSYAGWQARFLPTNDEFHKYNSVYSQESNAIYSIPDSFLFVKNTHFTNRILASKPKISGEIIDSWLDILLNEELYVEGEYGRINRLIKYNDNLYCFQRDAVSLISVLPRVQINPSDNIAIELGVGQVLNTYQYINTNSGCDDFNGITSTSMAVYYGDSIRRTINMVDGTTVSGISDALGISKYIKGFDTNFTYKPNYSSSYDPFTNDVFFSIQEGSNDNTGNIETLVYNEKAKRFTSILELPSKFIFSVDGKVHSIPDADPSSVWNHFIGGNSCNFFGSQKELELTICLNPEEAQNDCVFNALEWTHDIIDTSNLTHYDDNFTFMNAWNDYLTSSNADMSTIQRRFRMSRLFVPRVDSDDSSRMRGNYIFVKLKYLPDDPNKTILLNDIVVYYSAQR